MNPGIEWPVAWQRRNCAAWTFQGHYRESRKFARFTGWEERDLNDDLEVIKSRGWYNAEDYERQISD